MPFVFATYDAAELRLCGEAFTNDILTVTQALGENTEAWTEYVLDWFAASAGRLGVAARTPRTAQRTTSIMKSSYWPPQRQTAGELGYDLSHGTYPVGPRTVKAWDLALEGRCTMRLVLESEWGKATSAPTTTTQVLDDAAKLAASRADAKVLLLGSCRHEHAPQVYARVERLRRASDDHAPWLVIDLPWYEPDAPGSFAPSFRVLAGVPA